jgi:hypothetical protein
MLYLSLLNIHWSKENDSDDAAWVLGPKWRQCGDLLSQKTWRFPPLVKKVSRLISHDLVRFHKWGFIVVQSRISDVWHYVTTATVCITHLSLTYGFSKPTCPKRELQCKHICVTESHSNVILSPWWQERGHEGQQEGNSSTLWLTLPGNMLAYFSYLPIFQNLWWIKVPVIATRSLTRHLLLLSEWHLTWIPTHELAQFIQLSTSSVNTNFNEYWKTPLV